MSTELATTNNQVQAFDFFNPVQFETMQRVCRMFSSSELVPDMYKTNLTPDKNNQPTNPPEKAMANCMIAIEMAQRIGASPLMIMQNMVIIYGRPSWSSKFLVATVNTCGRFNPLQYKIESLGKLGKVKYTEYVWGTNNQGKSVKQPVERDFDGTGIENLQCIAFTSAKGSESILESSPVSIEMAIQEGWYTKAGSKWKTMTKQMLMYRAASFWTSAYAPELSMGMKTDDEVRDIVDVDYEEISTKTKVETEIKNEANKETIGFDAQQAAFDAGKPEPTAEPKNDNAGTQQNSPATDQQAGAAAGNGQPQMKF